MAAKLERFKRQAAALEENLRGMLPHAHHYAPAVMLETERHYKMCKVRAFEAGLSITDPAWVDTMKEAERMLGELKAVFRKRLGM